MSSALQNRLVGTIIVVALAVIFLPDWLDRKRERVRDEFVSVPATPARKEIVEPEVFPVERVKQATLRPIEMSDDIALDDNITDTKLTSVTAQNQPATASSEQGVAESSNTDTVAKSQRDVLRRSQNAVPQDGQDSLASQTVIDEPDPEQSAGWVIQLGSFKHQKNVRQLMNKVESAGYRVFSRPIQTSAGELTKVFVGPELDKGKLTAALPHLKEVTELQGKITTFTVQ